jgi:hypothetical protein
MDRPDLVARVQQRGRLAMRVATETGAGLAESAFSDHEAGGGAAGCRSFIVAISRRLFIDPPEAAFLARVVFGELNAAGHGITPAAVSPLAPPDLRPLLNSKITTETGQPTYAAPGRRDERTHRSVRIRVGGPARLTLPEKAGQRTLPEKAGQAID